MGFTTGCPNVRTACDYAASPVLLAGIFLRMVVFPSQEMRDGGPLRKIQLRTAMRPHIDHSELRETLPAPAEAGCVVEEWRRSLEGSLWDGIRIVSIAFCATAIEGFNIGFGQTMALARILSR